MSVVWMLMKLFVVVVLSWVCFFSKLIDSQIGLSVKINK